MASYEFTPCSSCPSPMACRDVGQCNASLGAARTRTPQRPTASKPDVVYASTIGELQEQLKGLPKGGSWLAEREGFGFASITLYDANGASIREIRNKK